MFLVHRLGHDQGATLKAYQVMVKSYNAACGPACEPRRAWLKRTSTALCFLQRNRAICC